MTIKFKVAIRAKTGEVHKFFLQHEDIQTLEDAYNFTKAEVEDGTTIMVLVSSL